MDKDKLKELQKVYPLHVEKYKDFIPQEENQNFIRKLNSTIDYLNRIGSLNDQTVKQWNTVMKWIVDEGLEEISRDELKKLYDEELQYRFDTSIEEVERQIVYAEEQANFAKEMAEKSEEQYERLKNTDVGSLSQGLADLSKFTNENESASLGFELASSNNWTSLGWTGDFNVGFKNDPSNVLPLIYPLSAKAGKIYQVRLTVEDTDLMNSGFKFKVTIGNSAPFEMYQGVGSPITYSKGIKAVEDGDLKIIPDSTFTGTIKNISVKEVVGNVKPILLIKDMNDRPAFETRPTKSELNNLYIGKESGKQNTTGEMNTSVGHGAMENNVSGFWNIAVGYQSLYKNINGSRNISLGRWSLFENISGARNVAIGSYSLHRLTTGNYNVAIGADSSWYTTTGSYNIAIGTVSLDKNTSGSYNTAIGYNALRDNETTSFNVAIGHHALRLAKQNNNTAIGSYALANTLTGTGLTAIGYQALNKSTGINNTSIGQQSAMNLEGGNGNTVIGRTTALSLVTGSSNTIVGQDGVRNMTEGQRNTVLGQGTGSTLTKGDDNILIGYNVNVPNPETNNYLSIGNLIYGDLGTLRVGIGLSNPLAKLHIGAGSATVPAMRINAGTLTTTPMIHSIEYDGAFLYLTSSNGNRRKIMTEAIV